jgi:hypothetical protein
LIQRLDNAKKYAVIVQLKNQDIYNAAFIAVFFD